MKNVLTAGVLAIAVIAASQQQASAWINARIGVGVNFGWQSGDNCFGWCGLWQNGPYPGDSGHHHGHHGPYEPPVYLPYIWVGHPHGHANVPAPSFETMAPFQYAYPSYPAPVYYYYPASYYYGR